MGNDRQPEGWERLTCDCGQERFAQTNYLRWKPGAGVTTEPSGYFCLECHSVIDSATLIARMQLKLKKQELKQLEEELEDPALVKTAAGKR